MNKKICVITGTRANYGRLKPIMKEIINSNKLELSVVVTGMHLIRECGYTVTEIEKDGFIIDAKVDMHLANLNEAGMCKSLGIALLGLTQAIESIKPDVILILGDRDEDLAGAIIGAHMNIPVAHIHGGEVTGTVDEIIRHGITKFSHIHFPATENSKERIIKLGENQDYVYNVCSPGLDSILNREYKTKKDIFKKYGLSMKKKLIILSQHPVTTEADKSGDQIRKTLEAVKRIGEQVILIYPNSDAGSRKIVDVIKEYEKLEFINSYMNIPFEDFLNLLKYTDVMVGNSSSGIMEAPSFKVPVVNVGTRQNGRECSTNLLNVSYNEEEIYMAIHKSLYDESYINEVNKCINPYGDGKTGKRIVEILESLTISRNLVQKRINY